MNKIGIFGGAFNPIHFGHLFIANDSIEKFSLKKIIFVPTGNPVFHKEDLLDKTLRLDLVKIAVAENSRFEVSSFEVNRDAPSYFINTLLHLIKAERCDDCYSIIGEDAFLHFHKWKDYMDILNLSKIIVAKRFDGNFEKTKEYVDEYFSDQKKRIFFLPHPLYPVSSTLIRHKVKNGESISYLLPEKIERIIVKNGYYK